VSRALALRRHRDELGAALSVHRSGPGPWTAALFLLLALLGPLAVLLDPGPLAPVDLVFPLLWAAVVAVVFVMLRGETLAVCERGLLIGSTAPFLRPYVVRYEEITPGSLVPVTGARRYGASTGVLRPAPSLRVGAWVRQGIHFVGPSIPAARRHPAVLSRLNGLEARSFDGRWLWFAGTGSTPPGQVTARIAQAAGRAGLHDLARATAAAPPRALTGHRADRAHLLPGYPA
jgi:hypothetical protein